MKQYTGKYSPELREQKFKDLEYYLEQVLDLSNWKEFINCVITAGYLTESMIPSSNALVYTYVMYLIGKYDYKTDSQILRRAISRWFYMVSVTYYYTGSFEGKVQQDLNNISSLKDSSQFIAYIDRKIQDAFTDDYFGITLATEFATTSTHLSGKPISMLTQPFQLRIIPLQQTVYGFLAGGKDYGLPHKNPSYDDLKPLDQFILADMGTPAGLPLALRGRVFSVTPPDDGSIGIGGMPHLWPIETPTFSADHPAGKSSSATVVLPECLSARYFDLGEIPQFRGHDRGMTVSDVVLRKLTLILLGFLRQEVRTEAFLEDGLSFIALVFQNAKHRGSAPLLAISGSGDTSLGQFLGDLTRCISLQKTSVVGAASVITVYIKTGD